MKELEHLSQSRRQLLQVSKRFSDCKKSINEGAMPEHEGYPPPPPNDSYAVI